MTAPNCSLRSTYCWQGAHITAIVDEGTDSQNQNQNQFQQSANLSFRTTKAKDIISGQWGIFFLPGVSDISSA